MQFSLTFPGFSYVNSSTHFPEWVPARFGYQRQSLKSKTMAPSPCFFPSFKLGAVLGAQVDVCALSITLSHVLGLMWEHLWAFSMRHTHHLEVTHIKNTSFKHGMYEINTTISQVHSNIIFSAKVTVSAPPWVLGNPCWLLDVLLLLGRSTKSCFPLRFWKLEHAEGFLPTVSLTKGTAGSPSSFLYRAWKAFAPQLEGVPPSSLSPKSN